MKGAVTRILATRPAAHNKSWAQGLSDLGYKVCRVPLLSIEPLSLQQEPSIRAAMADLDHYEYLIFVSMNAVKAMFDVVDLWWPELPVRQRYLAVGAATERSLKQQLMNYGVAAEVLCHSEMNSEGLLALAELQAVEHKKILICRGRGGRPLLAQVLEERGAQVDYCELYERAVPQELKQQLSEYQPTKDDILPVFSGEALNNFSELETCRDIHVLVPSERVKQQALTLGFTQISVAENASEASMLDAIQKATSN
ncbi:uroporphyrinogen-III synthase [Agaribacterium sp. ZY112]|uniref:uroporphyrinogen-III synthase n=1 Tax=Agaribacterium sp. ZY112 TaxID=3233574 RepID=UPI00352605AA